MLIFHFGVHWHVIFLSIQGCQVCPPTPANLGSRSEKESSALTYNAATIRTVPALLTSFFLPSLCYLSPNSLCILQDSRPSPHCSSFSGLPILDSSCKYLSFYEVPYSLSRFLSEKPLCKNTAAESSVCDDCQETFPVVFCISKRRLC
jgi:hypothetical protein